MLLLMSLFFSSDGWEISLVNFSIPGADSDRSQDTIYGVALVLQRARENEQTKAQRVRLSSEPKSTPTVEGSDPDGPPAEKDESPAEGDEKTAVDSKEGQTDDSGTFVSPISAGLSGKTSGANEDYDTASLTLHITQKTPRFNQHLHAPRWSDRVMEYSEADPDQNPITIGMALISSENVIPAMRDTISRLVEDFSRFGGGDRGLSCQTLVELLGVFAHPDVENDSLKCILESYTMAANARWTQEPAPIQRDYFNNLSGEHLIDSLPPPPLALLFATILLEQKIVFSSSRRGLLLSAVTAVQQLLSPLEWEHLVVPMVPEALATDLIQYPAPFLLGISSQDLSNLGLLESLPDDVTLVDLDIGRVILAPTIACDDEVLDGHDKDKSADMLRSQLLYLAQGLGAVFGAHLKPASWCTDSCDIPTGNMSSDGDRLRWTKLKQVCHEFMTELLAGKKH